MIATVISPDDPNTQVVLVVDIDTGVVLCRITPRAHATAFGLSPDGALLALGLAMTASGHAALGILVTALSVLFGWGYIRTLRLLRGEAVDATMFPTAAWSARPA